MNEIIKNIQIILICNKNEDSELYNNGIKNLKEKKLIEAITEILTKLKLEVDDDNKIEENELKKLRGLFQIETLHSYEYEQTMELLFKSIDLIDVNQQLDTFVNNKLLSNVKSYYEKQPIVSFSSLYLLLYYFYEKKHKNKKSVFEEKYKVQEFLDSDSPYFNNNTKTGILIEEEKAILEYLKRYINHDDALYKKKAYHLCHHLNIGLSLTKMIEFAIFNLSDFDSIENLVLFIGSTGVGKSTVINYLDGVEYELLDDRRTLAPKEGHFNKLKCAKPISNTSQTLYCEILKTINENSKIHFADLPGFFDRNLMINKSIYKEQEKSKNDCEEKIEVYKELIKALKNTENEKNSSKMLPSFLTPIRTKIYNFFKKNTEKEQFLVKFNGELVTEFETAEKNLNMVELTLHKWNSSQQEETNKRNQNDKFIKEYNAQKLMIYFILDALNDKSVFIFKCFREENDENSDDNQNFFKKINGLETNKNIDKKVFFKLESDNDFFEAVEKLCADIVCKANHQYSLLKSNFKQLTK